MHCYGSCGCRRLILLLSGRERTLRELAGEAGGFLAQKEITVTKKTKRSEKTVDIRPFIYQMEICDSGVFMQLASASSNYTKPELVMDTFVRWLDKEPQEFAYMIERREVYADAGKDKIPFPSAGSPGRKS